MSGTLRSAARLIAWTAGLLIAGRLLYSLGSDDVRIPLTSLANFRTWVADTPPPTMAIAVVRVAALAAIAYLLAATVLAVAAGLIRAKPLEAAAQRVTPAVVRRMATGGGGVGLALGTALGAMPSPDLTPHPLFASGALASPDAYAPDAASHDAHVATMTRYDAHIATMTRTAGPPAPEPAAASARSGPEETGATPGPGVPSPGTTTPTSSPPHPTTPTSSPPHPTTPTARPSTDATPTTSPPPAAASAADGAPDPPATGSAPNPAAPVAGSLPTGLARIARSADTPGPSPPAAPDDGGRTGTAVPPPLTATMIRIDGSSPPEVGSRAAPLPQPGNTWVVGPGDSFWSIAEDVLASPAASPPGEREVGRYWRRLIDANRDRLVDSGNPDLLLPGQELVLPP